MARVSTPWDGEGMGETIPQKAHTNNFHTAWSLHARTASQGIAIAINSENRQRSHNPSPPRTVPAARHMFRSGIFLRMSSMSLARHSPSLG